VSQDPLVSPSRRWTALAVSLCVSALGSSCAVHAAPQGRAGVGYPPQTIAGTELRALPRASNGRDYLLYVALPKSYAASPDKHYPVLYLCDGYWDFNLVKGFYGNLLFDKVIPEIIIVGIGYQGVDPDYESLRRWDLTPAPEVPPGSDGGRADSGHAQRFLGVVEGEIIPFIEGHYRVDSQYRALAGSSLGGLFALYAMFARPGLFNAVIAPSPAVNWASDWLFRFEDTFAASGRPLPARLFMTGAEKESPAFLAAIRRFDQRLSQRGYPGFTYSFRLIDGERHSGTKAESYNRGVRFAFAPLAPP
jgi:predicted alpha/beta superfamily hydrolase